MFHGGEGVVEMTGEPLPLFEFRRLPEPQHVRVARLPVLQNQITPRRVQALVQLVAEVAWRRGNEWGGLLEGGFKHGRLPVADVENGGDGDHIALVTAAFTRSVIEAAASGPSGMNASTGS